jgi:hypothetical protein
VSDTQPDWLKNATLAGPAVVPQTIVQVESKPARVVDPRSDAARIEAARATALINRRASQARAAAMGFDSGDMTDNLFKDHGFGSPFLARRILWMAQLINTPAGLINGKYLRDSNSFNPITGTFESETYGVTDISLFDLTVAFKLRIRELGLSQVLIEEHATTIHSIADDNAFRALTFDERLDRFKLAQV